MEIIYHIVADGCVLLLNGSFVQTATSVRYNRDEPLFVTALPLDAQYISYTVKLTRGRADSNAALIYCCDMGDGHFYVELVKQSAYVYPPSQRTLSPQTDAPNALLGFIKSGNLTAARSLLTAELSDSITDDALTEFFVGVAAIRENIFTSQKGYLLIKEDGTAPVCNVTYRGGLIDNISI